jgi:hypothetical protein
LSAANIANPSNGINAGLANSGKVSACMIASPNHIHPSPPNFFPCHYLLDSTHHF